LTWKTHQYEKGRVDGTPTGALAVKKLISGGYCIGGICLYGIYRTFFEAPYSRAYQSRSYGKRLVFGHLLNPYFPHLQPDFVVLWILVWPISFFLGV
jgi:hypothetical protein